MSTEAYKKSMEIEFFLRETLKPKPGSRTDNNLKDYYQSIVWYEQGNLRMSPSRYKEYFESFLKLFERAIDKKTNSTNNFLAQRIKKQMAYMEGSRDILQLYNQVKKL